MANPAYVQSANATTGTPSTLAFPTNNGAGNLLVVWMYSNIAASGFTVQDTNNGNVYSPVFSAQSDGSEFFGCFYLANCKAGANTVQWAATGGAFVRGIIAEYSGVATSSPLDGTPVIAHTTSATMTTLTANDLLLGLSVGQTATAAGTGYTIRENAGSGSLALEDNTGPPFVANSAGSNSASITGTAFIGSFAIAAFKAAVTTHSISGSAGVAGATVAWTGTASGSTTADGSGNYTIPSLADGSYTVTASKTGYTFTGPTPANPQVVSGADLTGVNFVATQIPVATPTLSPNGGTFASGPVVVTVTDTDSALTGFAMYYTTDGTTPTTGSTPYTVPISLSVTTTLKVLAVATGYANSSIASAVFTIRTGGHRNRSK